MEGRQDGLWDESGNDVQKDSNENLENLSVSFFEKNFFQPSAACWWVTIEVVLIIKLPRVWFIRWWIWLVDIPWSMVAATSLCNLRIHGLQPGRLLKMRVGGFPEFYQARVQGKVHISQRSPQSLGITLPGCMSFSRTLIPGILWIDFLRTSAPNLQNDSVY